MEKSGKKKKCKKSSHKNRHRANRRNLGIYKGMRECNHIREQRNRKLLSVIYWRTNGWMDGCRTNERTNEWMNGWMPNERTNEWMNEWMDGWMHTYNEWMPNEFICLIGIAVDEWEKQKVYTIEQWCTKKSSFFWRKNWKKVNRWWKRSVNRW